MISRLNDILVVSLSFSAFWSHLSFWLSGFNFHSIVYRLNTIYRLHDIISRLPEILVVLISILIFLVYA